MRKNLIILFTIILSFVMSAHLCAAEFKIILNKNNTIKEINRKKLAKIFLMKKKNWDNGDVILPVNLKAKNRLREEFSVTVLKKGAKKVDRYYLKKALSGKGQPPKSFITEKEIIEFVSWNEGAIGYVSTPDSSVKVIDVK